MSKKRITLIYLVLILLLVLIAIGLTLIRGGADLQPIDPKLTVGLTAITLIYVFKSFGLIVGLNVFVGFLLKRPSAVVLWVPIGTVLVLIAHQQIGNGFGMMELGRIGWSDAFMMYLPAVGLASFVGGLLANLFRRG